MKIQLRLIQKMASAWVMASVLALPVSALAQRAYPSAQAAADALVQAIATNDSAELAQVLGANWKRFIPTESVDQNDIYAFLGAWAKAHEVTTGADGRAHLKVGVEPWTLPIPITKNAAGWRFDVRAGADEMRTRRIGRNELAVLDEIRKSQGTQNSVYRYKAATATEAGFSLVAWPVHYGDSGIMTFVLAADGQVYQKNLGANTAQAARALSRFKTDDHTWQKVLP